MNPLVTLRHVTDYLAWEYHDAKGDSIRREAVKLAYALVYLKWLEIDATGQYPRASQHTEAPQ